MSNIQDSLIKLRTMVSATNHKDTWDTLGLLEDAIVEELHGIGVHSTQDFAESMSGVELSTIAWGWSTAITYEDALDFPAAWLTVSGTSSISIQIKKKAKHRGIAIGASWSTSVDIPEEDVETLRKLGRIKTVWTDAESYETINCDVPF